MIRGPVDDDDFMSLQPDWPDADQGDLWSPEELHFHRRFLLAFLLLSIAAGVAIASFWPGAEHGDLTVHHSDTGRMDTDG